VQPAGNGTVDSKFCVHTYPDDLAALVRRRWKSDFEGESLFALPIYPEADPLPPAAVLRELLSVCYQASLLREEGRPVRFRLIVHDPGNGVLADARPGGLELFLFVRPLPLAANELRRLAAAAAFDHALIVVRLQSDGRSMIRGLAHSGEDWVRTLEGSRRTFQPLPPSLVVSVTGPGNLSVAKGSLVVGRLLAGQLLAPKPSVLEVSSREGETEAITSLFLAAHLRNQRHRGRQWAQMNPGLISLIRRQIALRLTCAMRRLHHGGTLLILPRSEGHHRRRWRPMLNIKYAFPPGKPRRRLFELVLQLLEILAEETGRRKGAQHAVEWSDYLSSTDPAVRQVDEAITEAVRFIACLSAVDGAVVMRQPLELLGFGAEISGCLKPVQQVARALDPLASETQMESTMGVGTRHRSAYRICHALPGLIAVVVSQDGSIRLMKRSGNHVIYSDHLSLGVLDS